MSECGLTEHGFRRISTHSTGCGGRVLSERPAAGSGPSGRGPESTRLAPGTVSLPGISRFSHGCLGPPMDVLVLLICFIIISFQTFFPPLLTPAQLPGQLDTSQGAGGGGLRSGLRGVLKTAGPRPSSGPKSVRHERAAWELGPESSWGPRACMEQGCFSSIRGWRRPGVPGGGEEQA